MKKWAEQVKPSYETTFGALKAAAQGVSLHLRTHEGAQPVPLGDFIAGLRQQEGVFPQAQSSAAAELDGIIKSYIRIKMSSDFDTTEALAKQAKKLTLTLQRIETQLQAEGTGTLLPGEAETFINTLDTALNAALHHVMPQQGRSRLSSGL